MKEAYNLIQDKLLLLKSFNEEIQDKIDHFSNEYKRCRELYMENEERIKDLEQTLVLLQKEEE